MAKAKLERRCIPEDRQALLHAIQRYQTGQIRSKEWLKNEVEPLATSRDIGVSTTAIWIISSHDEAPDMISSGYPPHDPAVVQAFDLLATDKQFALVVQCCSSLVRLTELPSLNKNESD